MTTSTTSTTSTTRTGPVPAAAGLLDLDADGGPALCGTRCTACGTTYFPVALSCRNPRCEQKRVEPALLGRRGRLYSWTLQHYQPPPLFDMEDWQPYLIAGVDVDEGLRVLGMLTGVETAEAEDVLQVGLPLRLTTVRLRTDDDGRDVVTYAFTPDPEETA